MRSFLHTQLFQSRSITPLVSFRVLFGGLMLIGALRFMQQGWIEELYVKPQVFFKFYGFEWVEVLSKTGMYALYSLIAISAAGIMLGWYYRLATVCFFLSFSYSELIDSTNYLNHYYLVCLLGFLLIFIPANRAYSLDVWSKRVEHLKQVPAWAINCIILQISMVYCFAGLAKLNSDWIFNAMPLAVWLPTKADWPLMGVLFSQNWTAYAFSWAGAFYDLTIPFFLLHPKTRPFAYAAVIVFHVLTKMLFNIGLFPFIMIFNTLIFFSGKWHDRVWVSIHSFWGKIRAVSLGSLAPIVSSFQSTNASTLEVEQTALTSPTSPRITATSEAPILPAEWKLKLVTFGLGVYFFIQLALPFRYLTYPGHLLWTEEGYRFSWRVMLVEKVGQATFYVEDKATGRRSEINNKDYLTTFQEKQMSIQADMILQFAHYLAQEYQEKHGISDPKITVDSYVALNGRRSQRFIDPTIDLVPLEDSWAPKTWIIPFKHD